MTKISNLKTRRKNIVFFLYNSYLFNWDKENAIKEGFEVWNFSDDEIQIVENLYKNIKEYEKYIQDNNKTEWKWDRISPLDKAIMIFSIHEFKSKLADYNLAINEAIELSKIYSDPQSYKLINGILDNNKDKV